MYSVNFSASNGVFGLPNEVVDKHLKFSGALALKVLLLLYRHGTPLSSADLSKELNQSEGDVKDALNCWIELEMIKNTNESCIVTNVTADSNVTSLDFQEILAELANDDGVVDKAISKKVAATIAPTPILSPDSKQLEETKVVRERFFRMTRQDVIDISESDPRVSVLLQEAQSILARALSSSESESLVSIYHHYGMDIDIVLMLLTYCKSIDKDSPAYYEKMAIDWINRGILTHTGAEEEILKIAELHTKEGAAKKLFGSFNKNIFSRNVTKKEMDFYLLWKEEYKFIDSLISIAMERSVNASGKLSLPYTNAILKEWYEKNIDTTAKLEQTEALRSKNKGGSGYGGGSGSGAGFANGSGSGASSYDLDDFESLVSTGSIWD